MIQTIINAVWLVVIPIGYYPLVHKLVHWMAGSFDDEPDGSDWFFGVFIGFIVMLIWPVAIALAIVCLGTFMVSKRLWTGSWRVPWRTRERVS